MSFPPRYRPTRTGRASVAGDAARARVLETALGLFAASGFRGTSIAQIADQAGLSQSGLLHHYPTKAALLTAALEYRDEVDGQLLEVDGDQSARGWAAFEALIGLVGRNRERPELVRLYVTLSAEAVAADHPAHQWIRDHYAGLDAWLTSALAQGQAIGEIHPDLDPMSLARQTSAVIDGLQIRWLLDPEGVDMVADFRAFTAAQRARWAIPQVTGPA